MGSFLIPMTLHTESHLKIVDLRNTVHPGHIAVTLSAVKTTPDMQLMIEIDEVGYVVHPFPAHGSTILIVGAQLLDLRVMHDDPAVAEHARFQRRHAGARGFERARMTQDTTYFFLGRMNAMAERYRLGLADEPRVVGEVSPHGGECRKTREDHQQALQSPTRIPPT
jgi:hypothetical protein